MILAIKGNYKNVSLVSICRLFGITRQAFYQHFWHEEERSIEYDLILKQVQYIRKLQPVIGGRKLYVMLQPFLLEHQIKIGRDALFNLLAVNRLLVRKRKRFVTTTQSHHWLRKYPNLIKDIQPERINQIWVSDITYYKTTKGFVYISLITDAYSKKIVGYHTSDTMETVEIIQALHMATKENNLNGKQLIHHSDRGFQYCSAQYVKLLTDNGIQISMTENGDPLENAIAERVNGILKEEFLNHYVLKDIEQVKQAVSKSVTLYNEQRPHMSCTMLTPAKVHEGNLPAKRLWKNYYKQNPKFVSE